MSAGTAPHFAFLPFGTTNYKHKKRNFNIALFLLQPLASLMGACFPDGIGAIRQPSPVRAIRVSKTTRIAICGYPARTVLCGLSLDRYLLHDNFF